MVSISCVLSHISCIQLFVTLWTVACQGSLSMGSPSKNAGVGCHSLLQEIFPTQGSNLHLLCLSDALAATWEAQCPSHYPLNY